MSNQHKLNEGLRPLDLNNLVSNEFNVDVFRSKMGEDRDVCVVSFEIKDRFPANDLMEFIEKGYSFVLDADVSSGEDENGNYHVFVELPRSSNISEQIKDILYGVKNLSGIDDWKFRYHKKSGVHEADFENLKKYIPSTPNMYEQYMTETKTESIKSFFNKTLMDDLTLQDSVITIHKPFNQQIKLRWLNEDDLAPVVEGTMNIDTDATAEIFWFTKVLGDYNISKFGDKFLFSNNDRQLLLQRID
jgi:hypothetical protein